MPEEKIVADKPVFTRAPQSPCGCEVDLSRSDLDRARIFLGKVCEYHSRELGIALYLKER